MKRIALTASLVFWASAGIAEAKTVWILQSDLKCRVVPPKNETENDLDYVLHECSSKKFPTYWLFFMDSARSRVGFGKIPNFASGIGNLRQEFGPVEWGGEMVNGKFNPVVAITRVHFDNFNTEPPSDDNNLSVFRLLPNGTSCIVGIVGHMGKQNEKARAIGVAALEKWKCLAEPDYYQAFD